MPRANRYILPGRSYHVTHRCHNRDFLLKFAKDRQEYANRLRDATRIFDLSLLGYSITGNHTHLVINAQSPSALSEMMQKLEGEFAEYYNRRKKRSGAFWDGRYNCTMIDTGQYLWNCMKYVDLNMVRAGAVRHPRDWPWCGYHELVGIRQRYKMIDFERVLELNDGGTKEGFRANYGLAIDEAVTQRDLTRQPIWTETIAVGSATFIKEIEERTLHRVRLATVKAADGSWTLKEEETPYG